MTSVRPELGVLGVERGAHFAFVRWQPAATFRRLPYKIDTWKRYVHVVQKRALDAVLRAELNLFLPEERTPPEHALERLMLRSTPIVVVSDDLRAELSRRGVRVWTVGYHRIPELLHISATGGSEAPLWIEQPKERFFAQTSDARCGTTRPSGRPVDVAWHGLCSDDDLIDRIIRAASGGVLDEASILLAQEIERDGWNDLSQTPEERASTRAIIDMVRADPKQAAECFYTDLQWSHARYFGDKPVPLPDAELSAAVAAMAAESGPAEIDFAGVGPFFRELLPPTTLHLAPPEHDPGWLPGLDSVRGGERANTLHLTAVHRYARALKPGPWWEV